MTCLRERKIEIAIPGMTKSLYSCHEKKETGGHESDFNFDYCDNENDENGNSDDHEHEKNIIEMGIELWKEAERERDRKVLENEEREEFLRSCFSYFPCSCFSYFLVPLFLTVFVPFFLTFLESLFLLSLFLIN